MYQPLLGDQHFPDTRSSQTHCQKGKLQASVPHVTDAKLLNKMTNKLTPTTLKTISTTTTKKWSLSWECQADMLLKSNECLLLY